MFMKNRIIRMDTGLLLPKARSALSQACGFRDDSKKHRRMALCADEVLQKGIGGLRPLAVVSAYDNNVLADESVILDGMTFRCTAFARIIPIHVKKIYAFILTVGEVLAPDGDIMDSLYADIWGTAFTDAAMDALSEVLANDAGDGCHMAAFGPGFYGMDISYIPLLFDILDGSAIDVRVRRQSCCMIPLKSCAGFMIAAAEASTLPPADCMSCSGNRDGCRLCKKRRLQ